MRKRSNFSAIQLRYAGVKGVVSLDTRIREPIKLNLRPSMIKFECNDRCFEVCKLSAPRPVYLNRQAIILLSNRKISNMSFLALQQRNHLALIRNLLRNSDAQRLILEEIPDWLLPRGIEHAHIDFIREPFFRQLLINASAQAARDLLRRTRIKIPPNQGRNMIGIVDEYNVLQENEVFVQYTVLRDDETSSEDYSFGSVEVVRGCKVVITKNPCHHPGDVRTFKAKEYPQLKHLKDVIVFSQKGARPAPHDISGSDLDGDEYLVLWHPDLVPYDTENYPPHDYDAKKPNTAHNGPITRRVINETILDIAEMDCVGVLSKLHLAFADKFGVDDNEPKRDGIYSTIGIAAAISEELDSSTSGYHPLTMEEIKKFKTILNNERPDYFDDANFESYRSSNILGKRNLRFVEKFFFHQF